MKNCLLLIIMGGGILVQPLLARNMAYTHGHNYTYTDPSNEEVTFFPVVWDLQGTFYELRNYYQRYQGFTEDVAVRNAASLIGGVLNEAKLAGVNTLLIRNELMMGQA